MPRNVVRKTNLIRFTDESGTQKTLPNTPKNYLTAKQYQFFDNQKLSQNENPFQTLPTECSVEKEQVTYWYDYQSHFSYLVSPEKIISVTPTVFQDHLEEVILYLEKDSFRATDFGKTYDTPSVSDSQLEAIVESISTDEVTTNLSEQQLIVDNDDRTYTIHNTGLVTTSSGDLVVQTPEYTVPPKETTENISLDRSTQQYYVLLGRAYILHLSENDNIITVSQ
jgi:hypothetical protein